MSADGTGNVPIDPYEDHIEPDDPDYNDGTDEAVALPSDGLDIADEESSIGSDIDLESRIRQLVLLRETRDQTKTAASKAKDAFEEYQATFFEELGKSKIKGSVKVDIGGDHGVVQIVPRSTKYARILDRDKAREYFKERELDDEYVKDDFRMGRLHDLIRECIEQKKQIPDGLDFYTKEFFTITFKG